jgi:hypothetical protein
MHAVLSIAAGCIGLRYFKGIFLRYFLNDSGMVSFASVITRMTYFVLYMHCISTVMSYYIFWNDDSALTCVIVLYLCFGVSY